MSIVINLTAGVLILWSILFSGYCAYLRLMKDSKPDEKLGKIVWKYGEIVIIGTIIVSILTLSLVFAFMITSQLGLI